MSQALRTLVRVEHEGDFARVTMDIPERRNALSVDHMRQLLAAVREVGESDARGMVLAGEGPVFCSGHDFKDMVDADLPAMRELLGLCTELMTALQSIPQPVVARVHGLATAAGCQLVATADLAVASEDAGFAIPGGKGGWFCHTPLVAVARAVIANPKLILADEPTGNLHSAQGKEIMELFKKLNEEGTTIIQVTHSEANAAYGHRIINLQDGWVVGPDGQIPTGRSN